MIAKIIADYQTGCSYTIADYAGNQPLISLDGAGSYPRNGVIFNLDIGDVLDE